MKKQSLISRNPHIQFGAYCIRGTRIPVWEIKSRHKGGYKLGRIARDYGITMAQVLAAWNFRQKYPPPV